MITDIIATGEKAFLEIQNKGGWSTNTNGFAEGVKASLGHLYKDEAVVTSIAQSLWPDWSGPAREAEEKIDRVKKALRETFTNGKTQIKFGSEVTYRGTTRYGVVINDIPVAYGLVRVAWSSGPVSTEKISMLELDSAS